MDARKAPRRKLGTKAWIRLEGGFSMRPCTVVDMSTLGVGISIDTPFSVTDPFELLLSRERRYVRRCNVVWRDGHRIGAKFSDG